ncbi:hypothetical protein Sant_3559 [Sodalis praecaptivus]|uniref:DUF202 domain-containing protein n=1 Tax=Sodalis praecaptivus TaxID=1239307 RepID=W0HXG8_9GAMM|nr:DUF202 domain-containing protein [Sodalis praecaptivus]AHF78541.1 hypothetical protein Sant_3559 [Sodalis praecaptivus]CAJ0998895.1 Inner membrane protein YidH [Sodalis praecaptivus]
MQEPVEKSELKWWQQGKRPDYRFSLANERTFLAWIRTALALLAGAVGLEQFTAHFDSSRTSHILSFSLAIGAGLLGGLAWYRWKENEKAMRTDRDMPYSKLLIALSLYLLFIVLVFIYLTFID